MAKGEKHFEALDIYFDHAVAGAPDQWIAEQCSVPPSAVRSWRAHRGIKKASGMATASEGQRFALTGLSASFEPELHTTGNALNGTWEIPEFVLRVPLNYTAFCRFVYGCHDALGASITELAAGFGVRDQDILDAVKVWKRHLRAKGAKCAGCATYIDPSFGEFCCRRCNDSDDT